MSLTEFSVVFVFFVLFSFVFLFKMERNPCPLCTHVPQPPHAGERIIKAGTSLCFVCSLCSSHLSWSLLVKALPTQRCWQVVLLFSVMWSQVTLWRQNRCKSLANPHETWNRRKKHEPSEQKGTRFLCTVKKHEATPRCQCAVSRRAAQQHMSCKFQQIHADSLTWKHKMFSLKFYFAEESDNHTKLWQLFLSTI